jgi:hypothetical protein
MIIWMILQKRKEAAISFSQGLPESSLRYRLAQKWHHFAVFAVLLLLASAASTSSILGTLNSGQAMLTLLMVAALLSAGLDPALDAGGGLRHGGRSPQEQPVLAAATSDGPEDDVETEAACRRPATKPQKINLPPADAWTSSA